MGSRVIGFRVPDDLAEELERASGERGQTIGEFLRKLVDDVLYPGSGRDRLEERGKVEEREDLSGVISRLDNLEQQKEQAGLAQAQSAERIKQLEQRLATAEQKRIDDYSPREKAEFIIPWMQGLSGEDFVRLALETGHDAQLVPAADPEMVDKVAEIMRKQEREQAKVIQGKTELPGYRYLEYLNLSVYVGEEELDKERVKLVEAVVKQINEGLEKFGGQIVNTIKLETELIKNLAEIQRRRREGTL